MKGELDPMTKSQSDKRYRMKKAKKGWKIMTYLMPTVLVEPVREYIKAKTHELGLMK